MLHLLCDLPVKGLNVLQFAAKKGATLLLEKIFETKSVFISSANKSFDVTYLFPDTIPDSNSIIDSDVIEEIDELENDQLQIRGHGNPKEKPQSCLELIVNCENVDRAEEVLALYPFNELMQGYWFWCRWYYNSLLAVHVLFMALFTVYVMPTSDFIRRRFNLTSLAPTPNSISAEADASAEEQRIETTPLFGLFLIWPTVIIITEIVIAVEQAYRKYTDYQRFQRKQKMLLRDDASEEDRKTPSCFGFIRQSVGKLFSFVVVLTKFFNYVARITAIVFCAALFTWFVQTFCLLTV